SYCKSLWCLRHSLVLVSSMLKVQTSVGYLVLCTRYSVICGFWVTAYLI
ncbi:rhomboid family protease GlpG, partial [Vibrio parahaemolyticus V-223/04]